MLQPSEIAKKYSEVGEAKAARSILNTFILAIFAGAFISLGAFGSSVVACGVQPASLGRMFSALIFPIGLTMVVICGAELFTGNALIFVSVLNKKISVYAMLKNWLIVYIGNFVGSVFISLLLTYSHSISMYNGSLAACSVDVAVSKLSLGFSDAFLRGILCNILVCLAVWAGYSSEKVSGKILALFLPVMLFVVCGFEHCIANMYFIPTGIFVSKEYGIDAASLSWGAFFIKNLIPVTLGNIVGGSFIIGGGYFFVYLRSPKK